MDQRLKPAIWGVAPALSAAPGLWRYNPIVIPYWEGDGDPGSVDYRRLTGVSEGTGHTWTQTPAGRAVSLDGSDDNSFSFGDVPDARFTETTSFSILSVFSFSATGAFDMLLAKDSAAGTRALFQWRKTDTEKIELLFGITSSTLGQVTSDQTLSANQIYVACAVRDVAADQLRLFIDGKKDKEITDASTGTWTITDGTLRPQLDTGGDQASWPGDKILDIIFPTDALTDHEAIALTRDPFSLIRPANDNYVPAIFGGLGAPPPFDGTLLPNSLVKVSGWPVGGLTDINEGVAVADGNVMSTSADGEGENFYVEFPAPPITDADLVTAVYVVLRHGTSGADANSILAALLYIDSILVGGGGTAAPNRVALTTDLLNIAAWNEDWTAAQLATIRVAIHAAGSSVPERWDIDNVELFIAYTAGSSEPVDTININFITGAWSGASGTVDDIDEAISAADGNLYGPGPEDDAATFLLSNPPYRDPADEVTNVSVTVRLKKGGTAGAEQCDVEFLISGVAQGPAVSTGDLTGAFADYGPLNDAAWNADWTPTQLDQAAIRLTPRQSGAPGTNAVDLDCADALISYTASVPGTGRLLLLNPPSLDGGFGGL